MGPWLVTYAIVVRHRVDGLELLHLVDGFFLVLIVIANWIALVEVVLRHAASVLVMVRASSSSVIDRHAVCARVLGVESRAGGRQGESECLIEVACRGDLASILVLLAFVHSVLDAVDSSFVEAPVYDPAIIFASAVLEILRVIHEMLLKCIGRDGPLVVSCSFPAIALFLYAIKLILGLILRQNIYSRR